MNFNKISDLFYNKGLLIDGKNEKLFELNKQLIAENYQTYGLIIFRNFDYEIENLEKFTDNFTKKYANDATRRKKRLDSKSIRNVDLGNQRVDLHSETSFSHSSPEIVWFGCITPSQLNSGKTIFCDGIKLWENLSVTTKKFFLKNQIKYQLKIIWNNPKPGRNKKEWYIDAPGTSKTILNLEDGTIEFDYCAYAVNKIKHLDKLAFTNHLLIALNSEPQILSRTTFNEKPIPHNIMNEIKEKSDNLTFAFNWNKNDLVMIDNKRFMHGREKISVGDNRDIVTVQTLLSNLY